MYVTWVLPRYVPFPMTHTLADLHGGDPTAPTLGVVCMHGELEGCVALSKSGHVELDVALGRSSQFPVEVDLF